MDSISPAQEWRKPNVLNKILRNPVSHFYEQGYTEWEGINEGQRVPVQNSNATWAWPLAKKQSQYKRWKGEGHREDIQQRAKE